MRSLTKKAREAAADARYASIAKRYGMQNSLRALWEARDAGVSPALAMAILEQESSGHNVFGHDPTIFKGAGEVTKAKYLRYREMRRDSGNRMMQGVGPMQLTWWAFQDGADRMGGTWVPKYNLRYGYRRLAALITEHGLWAGVQRYNGSGEAAVRYRKAVESKYEKWHTLLHGH